jgi:hypothetical protein
MPQRPTRFRRRTQLGESAMVVKTDTCSVIVGDSDDPEDDCPPTDPSTDLSLLDITYSPTSNNSLPEVVGNTVIREGYEIFELPQSVSIQQAQRREFDTTITKTLTEACSTSSIRKKRRLPVNELPLLRTTSSEGLPQPSVRHYLTKRTLASLTDLFSSRTPGILLPLLQWLLILLKTVRSSHV